MKSFFEFFGFLATVFCSGALVFMFIGHNKNSHSTLKDGLVSAVEADAADADAPALPTISNRRGESAPAGRKAKKEVGYYPQPQAVSAESASERLRGLYDDQSFVKSAIRQWKNACADAGETRTLRADLLLANAIVQSYLGEYSDRAFQRDVSRHAGDRVKSLEAATRTYEYGWSVGKLAQQYNMAQYFPEAAPVAMAKPRISLSSASVKMVPVAEHNRVVVKEKAKPAASVAPAEGRMREVVAKEFGFSTWQGLQRLAAPDVKRKAEQKVKALTTATRIR